jgi:hypothetical protein
MKSMILKTLTKLVNKRDEIIYRRLGGEKISYLENKYWDVMDKVLDHTLPNPSFLPERSQKAIDEINDLLKERK